jgi:hypothetical protein
MDYKDLGFYGRTMFFLVYKHPAALRARKGEPGSRSFFEKRSHL